MKQTSLPWIGGCLFAAGPFNDCDKMLLIDYSGHNTA
jgi:hypothetical protein